MTPGDFVLIPPAPLPDLGGLHWPNPARGLPGEISQLWRSDWHHLRGQETETETSLSFTRSWESRTRVETKVFAYCIQRWASATLVRTSAIPQYCGQPNWLRNCGLKKLRNCDCGPSKLDFRNSATLCRQGPVSLLSSPFYSAQDGFTKQPTIFFIIVCSYGKQKLALKGQ